MVARIGADGRAKSRHRSNGSLVLLVAATVLAALTSCRGTGPAASSPSTGADQDRPLVITTFTVLADMASNVAGDHLRVESITKQGVEIHGYEPTPGDLRRVEGAILLLENGLNLERWSDRFLAGMPELKRATLTAGITPLPITEDAYRGKPNPHAWMSPRLAEIYVENIRQAFSQLDPANAEDYRRRAEAYRGQLRALDQELRRELATIPPPRRVLASCEGAFTYLAKDYGLDEAYLWPVNSESQVTPQRMARLIATVRQRQVPAVFCESTVSDKVQRQVAEQTGARFGGVFYVDSLSSPQGEAPTLLQLQRHNVRTLIQGLKGGS